MGKPVCRQAGLFARALPWDRPAYRQTRHGQAAPRCTAPLAGYHCCLSSAQRRHHTRSKYTAHRAVAPRLDACTNGHAPTAAVLLLTRLVLLLSGCNRAPERTPPHRLWHRFQTGGPRPRRTAFGCYVRSTTRSIRKLDCASARSVKEPKNARTSSYRVANAF